MQRKLQDRGPSLKRRSELPADWQSTGFTPGARHFAALSALLSGSDDDTAEAAERALARAGPPGAEAARAALPSAAAAARFRLARVVARVAAEHPDALRDALLELLGDADPRVQRAAITGLGKVGGPGVEAALLGRWERSALPERRALAEALGKVGGADSRSFLSALSADDPELERRRGRALVMLGRSAEHGPSTLDLDRPLAREVTVVLGCRHGLGPVLLDEARERGLPAAAERSPSEVVLPWAGALRPLFLLRAALDVGLELPLRPARSPDASVVAALESAAPLLRALSSGIPRFRLAWREGGHQRARTFRIAEALDPGLLVNDPRSALWEARVDEGARRVVLVARPDEELRFGYRGRDVPAASHPTVAAALARVAGVRADDVVWDPFVGSGLELCERGLLGPFQRLIGTDVSTSALDAARENLRRAGLHAELVRGEAQSHHPVGVTLVITNPPMGRRVARHGELADLMVAFLENVGRCLEPGGRLVWLSPLPALSAKKLAALGLAVERRGAVDLGGFGAELQVAGRGWTSGPSGAKIRPP
ncbi:MAG: hypothetical protein AMXMBFR56_28890 [Polyangiaceae bacterium]